MTSMIDFQANRIMQSKNKIIGYTERREYLNDPFAMINPKFWAPTGQAHTTITAEYDGPQPLEASPKHIEILTENHIHGVPRLTVDLWDTDKDGLVDLIQVVRKNTAGWSNYRTYVDGQAYMGTFYRGQSFIDELKKNQEHVKHPYPSQDENEMGMIIPNPMEKGSILRPLQSEDLENLFEGADELMIGIKNSVRNGSDEENITFKTLDKLLFSAP